MVSRETSGRPPGARAERRNAKWNRKRMTNDFAFRASPRDRRFVRKLGELGIVFANRNIPCNLEKQNVW